jgi:hypothetical protein
MSGQERSREEGLRGWKERQVRLGAHRSVPAQPCSPAIPREPNLFHPTRKPRRWWRGKPARRRSPQKRPNKASVGKRSWRRGGNKQAVADLKKQRH